MRLSAYRVAPEKWLPGRIRGSGSSKQGRDNNADEGPAGGRGPFPWWVCPVGHVRRVVCASPAYLAAHGYPRTPEDLAQHNCLVTRDFVSSWEYKDREGRSAAVRVQGENFLDRKSGGKADGKPETQPGGLEQFGLIDDGPIS